MIEEVIQKIKIYRFPPDVHERVAASAKRRLPCQLDYLNHLRHCATNYDALWQRYELEPWQVSILKEEVNRRLIRRLNEWHRRQLAYGLRGLPDA